MTHHGTNSNGPAGMADTPDSSDTMAALIAARQLQRGGALIDRIAARQATEAVYRRAAERAADADVQRRADQDAAAAEHEQQLRATIRAEILAELHPE